MADFFGIIFGVILGGLGTFFHQSYFSLRTQNVNLINDFVADLKKIEILSVEYWLIEKGQKPQRQDELAVRIRGSLHASLCFLETAENILASDYSKFKKLDGELFDTITGGSI